MAVLDLGRRYKKQPPNPVPIDRSGIGKKLRFALLGNCPLELANGIARTGTLGSNAATPAGVAYLPSTSATTWALPITDLDPNVSGSFSVNWYGYVTSNVQQILLDSLGTAFGWYCYLEANAPGTSKFYMYSMQNANLAGVTITIADNTLHSLTMCYDDPAGTAEFFLDGVSQGSVAWTKDTGPQGANQAFGMYGTVAQKLLTAQAYKGKLSSSEVKWLHENPYGVFKVQQPRLYLVGAASGSTGTVAKTNANDSAAASGTTTVTGTLARTNVSDTVSASGTTTVSGSLARTNAGDTVSASGSPIVSGTMAKTNANDSIAASGSAGLISGTLAKTNANDTSAASGKTTVTGSLGRTNVSDTVSATGTTSVTGALAKTNANDSIVASGSAGAVSGTLARTNVSDTSAASGTTTVSGVLSKTNANDSVAASGSTTVTGSISRTNANDTCAAIGSIGSSVGGSLSRTNANDSLVASGTTSVAGTLARTNTNDTIASGGTTTVSGALSRSNVNDSVSASGSILIAGSLAYINSNDSVSATGAAGEINTISSIVERTALFRATASRSATFRRSKSVTVKFN